MRYQIAAHWNLNLRPIAKAPPKQGPNTFLRWKNPYSFFHGHLQKILNIVQYIARAGNINIPNRFANMLETKVSSFWRPKYLLGEI